MKNLFVIYIGGSCKGSLIEQHDLRVVIAETIEDTYDYLKRSWWGDAESLHLDAWGILQHIDGHNIEITDENNYNQVVKLYFVNLGGYDSKQFTELHKNIFVVAANKNDAKSRALKEIENWESPHRDYLFEIDKILDISNLFSNKIKLTPCDREISFEFKCKYVPLGRS